MHDPAQVAIVRQMKEDFEWAMARHTDLQATYLGESIAVWRKQVVAHGMNEEDLLREAQASGCPADEVVVIEFPTFFESPR